ncbi:MAG: selenocysteine-specific translation elongation factor [Candidatus Electryonea clarkiae]|nr:selenocysteine-specific translation elongation factor [Candidatus Electryonea clarkiae]MDP8286075.1 selenocysteine-specific translation elongation factor [Candidatus Electryonea clarkiae]
MRSNHIVIGTAGHIDHGKTALVKALTGTDTDRLEEEKRRGITIDLGFAFYSDNAAFVDVPGHERLVKNMIAGASAMHAALVVVAADDGVMPQTREHLAVIDAMGIKQGIIAVTKADLAEDEWIELVVEEVRELIEPTRLKGSPVVVVDSISGRGIDELKNQIDQLLNNTEIPYDPGYFRMPVDRSFLIKGYGRVVTGTVWSGDISIDDRLTMFPGDKTFRVRGLQAHENTVERVYTGDRAALNLSGDTEPGRGDVLVSPGKMLESNFIDIHISLLPDAREVRHRMRVRLHLGTGEVIGRLLIVGAETIVPGTDGYARVHLESGMAVMFGDRGVLRHYSPVETLGGLRIIDPFPPDKRRSIKRLLQRLESLNSNENEIVKSLVNSRGLIKFDYLFRILPWDEEKIRGILEKIVNDNDVRIVGNVTEWCIDSKLWGKWKDKSTPVLNKFHDERPEEEGMSKVSWGNEVIGEKVADEILEAVINELINDGTVNFKGGLLSQPDHKVQLHKKDIKDAENIFKIVEESGLNVPLPSVIADELKLRTDEVRRLLRALKQVGRVVILDERVVVAKSVITNSMQILVEQFSGKDNFSVGQASEVLGSTRKYVVPLLEYLDSLEVTKREEDKRKIVG